MIVKTLKLGENLSNNFFLSVLSESVDEDELVQQSIHKKNNNTESEAKPFFNAFS